MDYSIEYTKFLKNGKVHKIKDPKERIVFVSFIPYCEGIYGVYIQFSCCDIEIRYYGSDSNGGDSIGFDIKENTNCELIIYPKSHLRWFGNIYKDYYYGVLVPEQLEEKYDKIYQEKKLWKQDKQIKR